MLKQIHTYSFETTGCVILENFLTKEEIKRASDAIHSNWEKIPWKFPVLHLDRIFWEMLTKDFVLEFCEHFCGEHFRLDHAFGLSSNDAITQLHGGPQSSQYSCFYLPLSGPRKAIAGQLNFGFCLQEQNTNTGGFVYVPGSHKTNDHRAGKEILQEVYENDFTHHSLVIPNLKPGDLMVFTEALIHGDTGWRGSPQDCRMQVYYKMTPGFMCWRDPAQNAIYQTFAQTDLERRLIEPPWTGRYSESWKAMGTNNERRIPTNNVDS